MRAESIDKKTSQVLEKIKSSGIVEYFYLAGGTALALQIGHRQSIDLDWFSAAAFSVSKLKKGLSSLGKLEVVSEDEGTLNALLNGIKISFFHYNYRQIFPLLEFNGLKIADERDIAAMKLDATSSRGSKKDFIDVYFLLQRYSLKELIGFFESKYRETQYNKMHILKSLAYFENADNEPMPIMLKPADWNKVKNFISSQVNDFLR